MPMIRAMRMLNALEAGTLDGPGLDTLLAADPSRAGELRVLLDMPGQLRRILSSETTLAGLAGAGSVWSRYPAAYPALAAAMLANPAAMAAAFAAAPSTDLLLGAALRPSVFASAAARAAMADSALGMANVTGDATKFIEMLASQPVLDEVIARPSALATLRASTALASISIPTMTAAAVPAGNVMSQTSVQGSGYEGWRAMDKTTQRWYTATNQRTNQWVRHRTAGVKRNIHRAFIRSSFNALFNPNNFRIEYSTDNGVVWNTAFTGVFPNEASVDRYFDIACAVAAEDWRLFVVDNHSTGTPSIIVDEFDLFGFVVP